MKGEIKNHLDSLLDYQYKTDGSDKTKCRPILLFHNIQTVINQNHTQLHNNKYHAGTFYKFPFHLYKREKWDVEHINSNTENPEDNNETRKEWLLNVYDLSNEDVKGKIEKYFESTEDEKTKLFNGIKKSFPTLKAWSSEEKNQIWNYVLLDSSTNRSYGNAIFPSKRRIIIGKDQGKRILLPTTKDGKFEQSKEFDANSSFVPPCTKQVFMKYYSPVVGDNNYWTKDDAENYKKDIEDCIKKLEK